MKLPRFMRGGAWQSCIWLCGRKIPILKSRRYEQSAHRVLGETTFRYTRTTCKRRGYMERLRNVAVDVKWMRYSPATENGKDLRTQKFERPRLMVVLKTSWLAS